MTQMMVYYWVKDLKTNENHMEYMEGYCGDIGEHFCGDPDTIVLEYDVRVDELELPDTYEMGL